MISVPYNSHLWGTWVGMGLFKVKNNFKNIFFYEYFFYTIFKVGDASKASIMPDFDAMYSGTPDSAWFVR